MNDTTATTTTTNANHGIDLNTALDILSRRTAARSQNQAIENENPNDNMDTITLQRTLNGISSQVGCGCCSTTLTGSIDDPVGDSVISEEQRRNGQVIDIGVSTLDYKSSSGNESMTVERKSTMHDKALAAEILDQQEKLKSTQEQAVVRQAQLLSTIQSMTTNDAISAIFHTQEQRVKCYRFFEEGLEYVLETGNMEYYPLVCADVTATFTVLSSTINAIRSDLGNRTFESTSAVVGLINRLQRGEQTKLQLTAALHLERMRSLAQHQLQTSSESNKERNDGDIEQSNKRQEVQHIHSSIPAITEQHDRIAALIEESIHTLRKKIDLIVEEINDVIEELRYTSIED